MGTVHAAYDPQLDRKIALKLVRPERGADQELCARVLREAQALAKLSHPNVVAVYDAGAFGEQVFIAMDFIRGTTLRQWLAARRPWREVLDTFLQAGRGLAAAHEVGLVHRDFKPDNVLVSDDGRARVVDFGLAAETEAPVARPSLTASAERWQMAQGSLTHHGALVGTPAYMSPEQLMGQPARMASDQFSFCVALFEGLYGERPFRGRIGEATRLVDERARCASPTIRRRPSAPSWPFCAPQCSGRAPPRGRSRGPRRRRPPLCTARSALASCARWRRQRPGSPPIRPPQALRRA